MEVKNWRILCLKKNSMESLNLLAASAPLISVFLGFSSLAEWKILFMRETKEKLHEFCLGMSFSKLGVLKITVLNLWPIVVF